MTWKDNLILSKAAHKLHLKLKPVIVEVSDVAQPESTVDFKENKITLNTLKPPLDCLMDYAIALKTLEQATIYDALDSSAKNKDISKSEYVTKSLLIKAEFAFFQCRVFRDIECDDSDCPFDKTLLKLYDKFPSKLEDKELIMMFALHLAKQDISGTNTLPKDYYTDRYDCLSGKKNPPLEDAEEPDINH